MDLLLLLLSFFHFSNGLPINDIESNFVDDDIGHDLSYLGEKIFMEPDPEIGKRLKIWNETHPLNPEEFGEYAEGDIVFPKKGRNGVVGNAFRWEGGVIPYEISGYFSNNDLNVIRKAMKIYQKYTCISFRPRTSSDKDYVAIVNGPTGCWSSVGRISGRQEINLQSPYCTTKIGTPLHELMHAVGFLHEQNRFERDDYVSIVWQNIKKGHKNNFDKASKGSVEGYGVPYDFRSVMHYSSKAFSSNGKDTIVPKDASKVEKMGQREGFSKGDITKINAMYNCPEKTANLPKPGETNGADNASNGSTENNEPTTGTSLVMTAVNFLSHLFTE